MKTIMKIIKNLVVPSLALSIVLFFFFAFVFYGHIMIYMYFFLSSLCLLYILWFLIRLIRKSKKFLNINSLKTNYQDFVTDISDAIKYDCSGFFVKIALILFQPALYVASCGLLCWCDSDVVISDADEGDYRVTVRHGDTTWLRDIEND
jgi:hypothetical protein